MGVFGQGDSFLSPTALKTIMTTQFERLALNVFLYSYVYVRVQNKRRRPCSRKKANIDIASGI